MKGERSSRICQDAFQDSLFEWQGMSLGGQDTLHNPLCKPQGLRSSFFRKRKIRKISSFRVDWEKCTGTHITELKNNYKIKNLKQRDFMSVTRECTLDI